MDALPNSDGPHAANHWLARCEIVSQHRVPEWDGCNWRAGEHSFVLKTLSLVAQAERLGASECVVEYLRHVVSCGGTESTACRKQFGRQREARLKLSAEWHAWEAAKKVDDEAAWAAARALDTGDDRGWAGGFLSSDD